MNLRSSSQCAVLLAGLAAVATTPVFAQPYQASFSYVSEPGDPVGLGQSMSLSQVNAAHDSGTEVWVSGSGSDGGYYLSLAAPDGQPLQPGVYENARSGSTYEPGRPALDFRNDQRGCSGVNGRFEITDIAVDPSGYVERLRMNFEQRCAGSSATLWGQVDIVKPEVQALTRFDIRIERFVELHRSRGDTLGYFTALCNTLAGGTYGARLEQRNPRSGDVVGSASARFSCGPDAPRHTLDFSSNAPFRPGPATLTVDAFVIDPKRGEQGAGYVTRVVTSRVVIRPVPERRATRP